MILGSVGSSRNLTNGTANTNNTEFSVDAANDEDYRWLVEYSVDETHDGVMSECGKETFTATLDDDTTNERGADAVSTPAQRLRESCKTCL